MIVCLGLLVSLSSPALASEPSTPETRAHAIFKDLAEQLKAVETDCALVESRLGSWLGTHTATLTALVPELAAREAKRSEAEQQALNQRMEPVVLQLMAVATTCEERTGVTERFMQIDAIMNPGEPATATVPSTPPSGTEPNPTQR